MPMNGSVDTWPDNNFVLLYYLELEAIGKLLGPSTPLGIEKLVKEKESLEQEEEEEQELVSPVQKKPRYEKVPDDGGLQFHFLFKGEGGYLCIVPQTAFTDVRLRVTPRTLWLNFTLNSVAGKGIRKLGKFLEDKFDMAAIAPEFEQDWVAQGCHRSKSFTYRIELEEEVETAAALISREEDENYVCFFVPFTESQVAWV